MLAVLLAATLVVPCYHPPVDAPAVDPYREPACPYCPGNRGIEYGPQDGQIVVAATAGTVSFAGVVAGTRYVVVDSGDGLRLTYGKLGTAQVDEGDRVQQGQRLGTTSGEFFLGLRRGDDYLDPTPYLGRLRYPTRLIPTDGTRPRAAGPPRLVCREVRSL